MGKTVFELDRGGMSSMAVASSVQNVVEAVEHDTEQAGPDHRMP